jgi:ABC-type branched-subunit amino acid transport system ATPase component
MKHFPPSTPSLSSLAVAEVLQQNTNKRAITVRLFAHFLSLVINYSPTNVITTAGTSILTSWHVSLRRNKVVTSRVDSDPLPRIRKKCKACCV